MNAGDLGTIVYHRLAADASKENAGDDITLTASYAANANYAVTVIDGTLTIGKRTLTITVGDGSKTYGEADPAFDVQVEGAAGTDTIETPGTKREPGEDVGTYEVTADIDEADYPNYDIEIETGELTIGALAVDGSTVDDKTSRTAMRITDVLRGQQTRQGACERRSIWGRSFISAWRSDESVEKRAGGRHHDDPASYYG